MSDLVGNPEDRFFHNEAQMIALNVEFIQHTGNASVDVHETVFSNDNRT